MLQFAALAFVTVLAGLALFQATLIAGAPLGHFAWGGQHRVLPRNLRLGSVISIVIYALFALVVLDRAGLAEILPDALASVGIWVIVAYLALGVVVNLISRSLPERLIMTPVALVLCVLGLVVALT